MKARIIGDGVITAGEYDNISVIGEAKVIDAFSTKKLSVIGEINSEHKVVAKKGRVIGEMYGNEVYIDEFRLIGEIEANILSSGKATTTGDVKVSNIKANNFITKSSFLEVNEISADLIDLRNASGSVKSILGEKIMVYKKKDFSFSKGCSELLYVDEIEGDNIYLEKVNAKRVAGNNVEIGPNCIIEYLDAKNMKVHKSSTVKVGERIE
ncbi:hypothetical protein RJG79_09275 [Mycoplasmatota bacterium WC44]